MVSEIFMPKMSNTMTEGKIMRWFKKENDYVEAGDAIVEIMTDKVNREIEATESGFLRKIIKIESNDDIKIGEVIGLMANSLDEELPAKYNNQNLNSLSNERENVKITPKAKKLAEELGVDISLIKSESGVIKEKDILKMKENEKINVTPLAHKIAIDKNVSLKGVEGTGINGKIVKKDVERLLDNVETEKDNDEYEIEPIIGVRGIIAERMTKSKFTSPHVYFFKEVNMEKSIDLRKFLNHKTAESGLKLSMTDIITHAVIRSLIKHPQINVCIEENKIMKYKNVNISLAVDTDRGLVVPVIKKADKMSLSELSLKINEIISKARSNQLDPEDFIGGTFTVSNLGSFDSDSFTAIINAPQAAILAVSSTKKRPVVVNDTICIKPMMNITLSVDHRVIDGVKATEFINQIRDYLENPELMLL